MDYEEVNDYDNDNEEEYEEPNDEINKTIRSELSQTPFEDLLKLKDKLGTKVYNETIIDKMSGSFSRNKKSRKTTFKRDNKNRPQEISSKRPVPQLREVFQIKKKNVENERRDPRFQPECGQFNEVVFKQTFGFLNDIKEKEINDLKKMLKKTKSEEKRQELKHLLQRLENQRTAEQQKEERKKRETDVRNSLKLKTGNKQTFVNKSTLKRFELVEKFKQLKKSGKLEKYMEKKRKRNATRERKKIPSVK